MNLDAKLNGTDKRLVIMVQIYPNDNVKINGKYPTEKYANQFVLSGDEYIKNVIGKNIDEVIDSVLIDNGITYETINFIPSWELTEYPVRINFNKAKTSDERINQTPLNDIIDQLMPAYKEAGKLFEFDLTVAAYTAGFQKAHIPVFEDAILRKVCMIETIDGSEWQSHIVESTEKMLIE
jgi:hypothetical protein